MRVLAILGVAVMVTHAAAQPESLVSELVAVEHRAADKSVSLREREEATDKAMELRKQVIAAAPAGEPRLPGWLMDQAAAELARLARDGSDTAALFAIPLATQTEAVRDAADRALKLITAAGAALEVRQKALTEEGVASADPRMVQAEQDRTVRVPFFGARARVLLAACATGKDRTRHAQGAFDLVGKLTLASPAPESIRRISLGAALLMRADPPDATDIQSAIEEFGWVLTGGPNGQSPAGVSGPARAEAWFGLVNASGALDKLDPLLGQFRPAMSREPFTAGGRPDPLLIVLAADAVTRSWAEQGLRRHDRAKLDLAVAEQQALLRRTDLGVRAESLRPLAFQKLYLLASRADKSMDLPPAMDLAGAIDAARDSKRRDEAIKRLRAVADSPDAGDFAGDALWEAAVLLTQAQPTPPDRLAAGMFLTRLARDFPQSSKAPEAMGAALAYLQSLVRERASVDAAGPYLEALTLVTTNYTSLQNIDTWRYERARMIVDGKGPNLGVALRVLREVAPGAPIAADATRLCERVQAEVLDTEWKRFAELRKTNGPDALKGHSRDMILPEARRAVDWARSRNAASLDRFRADLADAMTEAGDGSGGATYAELLQKGSEVPGGSARLNLGRARALLLTSDAAGAFTVLRHLATSLDAPPAGAPPSSRPDIFWHAWTLMLEELSARNEDGSRTGTLRANIRRLESIDGGLGGEPWKSRIAAVAKRLKP